MLESKHDYDMVQCHLPVLVLCRELILGVPSRKLCCAPCTQPNALVNVKLIGARDLQRQDEFGEGEMSAMKHGMHTPHPKITVVAL